MEDWVLWLIAAGVLAVGEIVSLSFFMGPIAVAAVAASVAAALGAGLALQLTVFIVASIASIGVLRPIARRHLKTPAQLRTGTQALVGAQAEVLERVDRRGGQIKLAGEIWTRPRLRRGRRPRGRVAGARDEDRRSHGAGRRGLTTETEASQWPDSSL